MVSFLPLSSRECYKVDPFSTLSVLSVVESPVLIITHPSVCFFSRNLSSPDAFSKVFRGDFDSESELDTTIKVTMRAVERSVVVVALVVVVVRSSCALIISRCSLFILPQLRYHAISRPKRQPITAR